MPKTIPPSRPQTDAILTALAGTGLPVGDGEAPAGSPPYLVLYVVTSGFDGPAEDPQADMYAEFQVTAVGDTREQAEWARDKARAAMAAGVAAPAGRSMLEPVQLLDGGPGVQRDDAVQPPLFYAVDLYEASTTPG